nr:DUF1801 domain-containing protein [Lysobacter enzymogenes]
MIFAADAVAPWRCEKGYRPALLGLSVGALAMTAKTSKSAAKAAAKPAAKPATKTAKAKAGKPADVTPASRRKAATAKPGKPAASGPRLLSGGNPQIPKGHGDAPVQAYLDAVPGWKREIARRLDALVERTVPGVSKAVKWNTPLYAVEEGHWFLAMHCFDRYLKVTFFRGAALDPPPAHASKMADVRYHHIHEHDPFDEARLADWIAQASRLPGERM